VKGEELAERLNKILGKEGLMEGLVFVGVIRGEGVQCDFDGQAGSLEVWDGDL